MSHWYLVAQNLLTKDSAHFYGAIVMKSIFVLFLIFQCAAHAAVESFHLQGWYPTKQLELTQKISSLEQQAQRLYAATVAGDSIRALIVPHAGYEYSGTVAAGVYRLLKNVPVKRAIILVPDHSATINGIALPLFCTYKMPNGALSVDDDAIQLLSTKPLFKQEQAVYSREHSLEVQLPFTNYFLPNARIVPLMVGTLSCEQARSVAKSLQPLIDAHTVVIVSTDFVHYGKGYDFTPFKKRVDDQIRQINSQALQLIDQPSCSSFERFMQKTHATICGVNPIKILINLLQLNALGPVESRLIAYDSSGDPAQQDSVYYIGELFTTQRLVNLPFEEQLTQQEKNNLLHEARQVLNHLFDNSLDESLDEPIVSYGVKQPHGAYVTLRKNNELRGCIGHTITQEPLYKTVKTVTKETALHDTRFAPVTQDELKEITVEVSILSPLSPIKSYREIVLGKHGVVLSYNGASALFLPEVAIEFKWTVEEMLDQLAQKAGLPATAWREKDTQLQVFTTITIK